ncbi:MAG: tyrosine-type recombinase/integrase [Bacteriovoracia bacterium]
MAFPVWRRNKQVTVYYYDKNTQKQVQLSRKETKHLDQKPKDEVIAWVQTWERNNGKVQDRSNRIHLKDNDTLAALWKQYQSHRIKHRRRRIKTAKTESEIFDRHIIPFFVGNHQKKDPATWHDLVPEFHAHLFEQQYADRTIQKILWTLERFGKHLVFQRYMIFPFVVQVPARENHKVTPLKVSKSPEEIVDYVENSTFRYNRIDFKLMVLLGYFAALRPSELFALNKSDLLTSKIAEKYTKTLDGFRKHKIGSRLSISITKTLSSEEGAKPNELTKNEVSRAVVNIWHLPAARLIADLAKGKPEGRLFPFSYPWLERAWRTFVKPTLHSTPHDLRRASCLFLGRRMRIDLTLLQDHMRHAEIETTMLYTREPSVPKDLENTVQDFDDVA